MNRQDVAMLNDAIGGIRDNRIRGAMLALQQEEKEKERAFRDRMAQFQQEQAAATAARTERDFNYRAEQDTLARQRQSEQDSLNIGMRMADAMEREQDRNFRAARATAEDQRFAQEMAAKAKQVFDDAELKKMEMQIRKEIESARNSGAFETVELDPVTKEPLRVTVRRPAGMATPTPPATPALSEIDQQALTWAQANPNDPRAAQILKRLGL